MKMVFRRLLHPRQLQLMRTYCISKETIKQKISENTETPKEEPEKNLPESFSRLGDNGTSKTIDGTVLPKDNEIFNAIGATEELLSFLGLAKEHANESEQLYTDKLKRIQTIIIDISTAISRSNLSKCSIPATYTTELEDWIHEYCKQLPPPEQYIIPGGGVASASLHVARAVCRKTERVLVPLVRQGVLDMQAQIYLNRLSDFLFTISRIAAKHDQRAETIYIPKPDEKVQAQ